MWPQTLQAAILTGRREKTATSLKEIDDSVDRIVAGMEGTPMVDSKSKLLVAYHEVGHAVCATLTEGERLCCPGATLWGVRVGWDGRQQETEAFKALEYTCIGGFRLSFECKFSWLVLVELVLYVSYTCHTPALWPFLAGRLRQQLLANSVASVWRVIYQHLWGFDWMPSGWAICRA